MVKHLEMALFSINAVLGKSNIMDRKFNTFISSTFWTERAGPSAGLKTLQEMNHLKVGILYVKMESI